jgi:hypothetical protein
LNATEKNVQNKGKGPRPLLILLALAFLFETWIWGSIVALAQFVAAFKAVATRFINRMPALFSVLLFGVPLVVSEVGSFLSVVSIALGHIVVGALAYCGMKLIGIGLVAVIFDITREKLMTLPWFVVLYEKFVAFHDFAHHLIAPYKDAALAYVSEIREWARSRWLRLTESARDTG